MKVTCNMVDDLLPLVAEGLASEDSVKLVKSHIKDCPKCKLKYEETTSLKRNKGNGNDLDPQPLKGIKQGLKQTNIFIGVLTALIITLVLFIGFDKLTKPVTLPYEQVVDRISEQGDIIIINFKEDVTDYEVVNYTGDEYEVMGWKTYLGSFFKHGENKSAVINPNGENVNRVYYISGGEELDKLVYGKPESENAGQLTLPRLAMNYYVMLAGIIFVISLLGTIVFQKKESITKIILPIMLLSVSYILSHIVILGLSGTTHHIIRDLTFVVIATILFFAIFSLMVYKGGLIKLRD